MKKGAIFLIILLSLLVISAMSCAMNTASTADTIEPKEMVSERVNTLIEKGDKIFESVLEEYPIFNSNCDLSTDMKEYLDYVMFPDNWDGTKTFSERMKDVYWSENNIALIMSSIDASLDTTKSTTEYPASLFFDRKKNTINDSRFVGAIFAVIFAEACLGIGLGWLVDSNNLHNQIDYLEALNTQLEAQLNQTQAELDNAIGTINSATDQLHDVNSQIDKVNNYLTRNLQGINYTISSFKQALRSDLYTVNSKMDTQLKELGSLTNDINILREDILDLTNITYLQDLKDPMARVDGFLSEYGMCVDWSDARLLADDVVKDYGYIGLRFIDCAKSLQSWAADPSKGNKYSALVPASHTPDPSSDVPVIYAKIEFDNSGDVNYYFDYTNPQRSINIGLGNLIYLSKLMMTRFTLNHILFWGSTLTRTNKNVAQGYLDLLDSSNIKPSILAALTTMNNEYENFKSHIHINFGDIYDSNHITKITYYKNGTEVGTTTTLTWDEIENLIYNGYASSYMSYLGQIFQELITLEINLNAYIQ